MKKMLMSLFYDYEEKTVVPEFDEKEINKHFINDDAFIDFLCAVVVESYVEYQKEKR